MEEEINHKEAQKVGERRMQQGIRKEAAEAETGQKQRKKGNVSEPSKHTLSCCGGHACIRDMCVCLVLEIDVNALTLSSIVMIY